MPTLNDTDAIISGYGQEISDWALGDDRIFTGNVSGLPASDPSLVDAYFTLKSSPNSIDANAILQKHITQVLSAAGQITAIGGKFVALLLHVFSADYEGLVNSGQVYYWDFRVITTDGATWTIAQGQVQFVQNVTQTNVAGTPSSLPNEGQPRFRGFLSAHPNAIPGFNGIFNQGDWFRNANAASGEPSGWVAINACFDATGFRTDGIVGDT
jgi:hypothetical protein